MAHTASGSGKELANNQLQVLNDRIKRIRRFLLKARRVAQLVKNDPNLSKDQDDALRQEIRDIKQIVQGWSGTPPLGMIGKESDEHVCKQTDSLLPCNDSDVIVWLDQIIAQMASYNCAEIMISPDSKKKLQITVNASGHFLDWMQVPDKIAEDFMQAIRKLSGNEIVYNDRSDSGIFQRILKNQTYRIKVNYLAGVYGESIRLTLKKLKRMHQVNISLRLSEDLLKIIPANLAIKYQVIPLQITDDTLDIIMPERNNKTIDLLTNYVGKMVNALIVEQQEFKKALKILYSVS